MFSLSSDSRKTSHWSRHTFNLNDAGFIPNESMPARLKVSPACLRINASSAFGGGAHRWKISKFVEARSLSSFRRSFDIKCRINDLI